MMRQQNEQIIELLKEIKQMKERKQLLNNRVPATARKKAGRKYREDQRCLQREN